jgi:ribonuclease HI
MESVIDLYVCGVTRELSPKIGAATSTSKNQEGEYFNTLTQSLPPDPTVTYSRAELLSVVIGLRQALARAKALAGGPSLMFNIHTNSKNAFMCMKVWRHKWERNG